MKKSPIFIIGNPRSGTTLLRLMLSSHKNIVIAPESGFSVWFYPTYKDWNPKQVSRKDDLIDKILKSRKFDTWGISELDVVKEINYKNPQNYVEFVSCIYELYAKKMKKEFKRWGDKNGFYVKCPETIKELFQDAVLIHIVRDGRDIACSYRELMKRNIQSLYKPNLNTSIFDIANEWRNNLLHVSKVFNDINSSDYMTVRYEDLVLNTESSLRKICFFLGEVYDENMNNFYVENQVKSLEPVEFIQWKEKTLLPIQEKNVGKYKNCLSNKEKLEFESIAGDVLSMFNYI